MIAAMWCKWHLGNHMNRTVNGKLFPYWWCVPVPVPLIVFPTSSCKYRQQFYWRLAAMQTALIINRRRKVSESILRASSTGVGRHIYSGIYSEKMRLLRRVSIASSVGCGVGLPLALNMISSSLDPIAQIAVTGTAIFASLSSTLFLQLITHPYVVSLEEITPSLPTLSADSRPEESVTMVRLRATRLSIMGFDSRSEFNLSEVRRIGGGEHPFATFAVKSQYYYVLGDSIKDDTIKKVFI